MLTARERQSRDRPGYAAERAAASAAEKARILSLVPEQSGNCYGCGVTAPKHAEFGCKRFVRGPHG